MTACDHAQRLAEQLIRHACRDLPDDIREDRYDEWAAELPAILYDPNICSQTRRIFSALLYAADHSRGVLRYPKGDPPIKQNLWTALGLSVVSIAAWAAGAFLSWGVAFEVAGWMHLGLLAEIVTAALVLSGSALGLNVARRLWTRRRSRIGVQ